MQQFSSQAATSWAFFTFLLRQQHIAYSPLLFSKQNFKKASSVIYNSMSTQWINLFIDNKVVILNQLKNLCKTVDLCHASVFDVED